MGQVMPCPSPPCNDLCNRASRAFCHGGSGRLVLSGWVDRGAEASSHAAADDLDQGARSRKDRKNGDGGARRADGAAAHADDANPSEAVANRGADAEVPGASLARGHDADSCLKGPNR